MSTDLRFAVIGLGFGANHARILTGMPGVCLAAVVDTDPARLKSYDSTEVQTYTDYRAMVGQEQLDAVIVAVPALLHEAVSLAAIEAGCSLLIEKPLAPCLADATRIVDAARQRGVLLMPGHIERFNPAVAEAACRVRDGQIGRVLHLAARRMSAARAGAHGSRLPPRDVNVVHDSAIHDIDAFRYVLGLEVASVFAAGSTGIVTPAEDSISAVLRFAAPSPDTEAPVAGLDVSWLSHHRLRDLTIMGELGSLLVDYAAQTVLLRSSPDDTPVELPIQHRDQLESELAAFVSVVRDGGPPPVTPQDGLAAVAVADALTVSARTGAVVAVEGIAP